MRRFLLLLMVGLGLPGVLGVGVTFTNVGLGFSDDKADVAPGEWVLAQKIQADTAVTLTKVVVYNQAATPRVLGADVERIEVRRTSDGKVMGYSTALAKFAETEGVTINLTANKDIAADGYFEVWVKLRATVPLGRKLKLVGTKVTHTTGVEVPVTYPAGAPATEFTVGPSPDFTFDESVEGEDIYPGQRFLAGRIEVNAEGVPFETTISRILLTNDATDLKLPGTYIAAIEVRRANDDALLGEASSAEIAKFSTTGTAITTSTNNKVPAFTTVFLEIWITLKSDAPPERKLKLKATVRCSGTDFSVEGAWEFQVEKAEGLEGAQNLDLAPGRVFSRQRFLAQQIRVEDSDTNPHNVRIDSVVVQNVASGNRLAETHIAKIEVVRGRDGALMGSVTNMAGLNSGGVRILTPANDVVADDTSEILELWVTLGDNVPDERELQLRTVIWHTEDTRTFRKPETTEAPLEGPTFTTGPETADGFEDAKADTALTNRTVFQGGRFLAQRLVLKDNDVDPYNVTITSLVIRNLEGTVPLADQHVAKIEVRRRSDNALLGQVTDPVGLSLTGTRVATTTNNVVPDDTTVELEIWVTLKDTAPKGRKLKLGTVVWHSEGASTFQTSELAGPATFTTDIGQAPKNVDFTWTPDKPEAGKEVTFTPSPNISDPTGLANATFTWNLGDGTIKETKGSASIKHTYAKGGTFSVTLTVTNVGGLSSSKTKGIEVIGKQPVVDFSFSPTEPMVGDEVTFTAKVTDPATPPLTPYTYAWNFGDGATSAVENPKHAYTAAGTYTVTLEVTNSRGETGKATKTITVKPKVNVPPTVTALSANPAYPETNQQVTFSATATAPSDDPVTGWEWDFGDGATGTAAPPVTHTYTTSGIFTVRVRAKNEKGGWSSWKTLTLYVRPAGGAMIAFQIRDNPASTQCRIDVFAPPEATDIKLTILDQAGRLILQRTIAVGTFTWDLKDENGRTVPNGLYLFYVTAKIGGETKRTEVGRILVRR